MMLSLWIKVPYTIFVCAFVAVYWVERGPTNFLWLSDIALLATVPALWMENRFLASMMAVGVLLPELAWNLDFFLRLITGYDVIGLNGTGYMFATDYPSLSKFFSLFHVFRRSYGIPNFSAISFGSIVFSSLCIINKLARYFLFSIVIDPSVELQLTLILL